MKSFLKYTLATITGLILSGVLFFFVSLASFSIMLASAEKPVTIANNSVLVLNTGLAIPERGNDDPWSTFDPVNFSFKPSPGINDILANLKKAVADEKIKGVLIENGLMDNGWGKAEEIRNALLKFKESGKFIISYTDYILTQEAYFISTAADEIYVNPNTMMQFKGLSAEVLFYKKALEKLGVNVQVVRHGKFKGAVEPYLLDKLSNENRRQIKSYTSGIWNYVLDKISEARGISTDELNRIADNLSIVDIGFAKESNMIDDLLYKDELLDKIKELCAAEDEKKPDLVSMAKYKNVSVGEKVKAESKIALLYAEGTITMGKGNTTNIGGDYYSSIIRKIRESDKYDALVIRISSPGGNAMASDHIWREVELAAAEMPVVVSMSNYAASGGYYIAAPATKIIAQATTITGSIGVFGLIPEMGGLLEEKLGITSDIVKTNKYADNPSFFRSMNDFELGVYQQNIDRTYDKFIEIVSSGRNIEKTSADLMGEGQVYYGIDALGKNLVDKLGGLDVALAEASELASVESYSIVEFPKIEDTYTRLLKSLSGEVKLRIIQKEFGSMSKYFKDINDLQSFKGIQARLPYFIDIR